MLPLLLYWLFLVTTVVQCTTICLLDQPRLEGAPSNETISQALHSILATSHHGPCSGKFSISSNGFTENHIQRSNGSLVLEITRVNSAIALNNNECIRAFNSIIHNCVRQGIFWGGNATSPDVKYTIYNDAYPSNWKPIASAESQHSSPRPLVPPHATAVQWGKSTPKSVVRLSQSNVRNSVDSFSGVGTVKKQQFTRRSSSFPKSPTTARVPLITTSPTVRRPPTSGSANVTKTVPYGVAGALGAAGGLVAVGGAAVGIAGAQRPEPYDVQTHDSSFSHSMSQYRSSSMPRSPSTSMSSSSPTASSSSAVYFIFPKAGFDTASNTVVTDKLRSIAGNKLAVNENPLLGLYFWAAPLTPEEKKEVLRLGAVLDIVPTQPIFLEPEPSNTVNGFDGVTSFVTTSSSSSKAEATSSYDSKSAKLHNRAGVPRPPDTVFSQPHAPLDLVEVSLPPRSKNPLDYYLNDPEAGGGNTGSLIDTYYYDPKGGRASTVYVMDTGASTQNEDYENMGASRRWLFASADERKEDPINHGGCVLSKVAGSLYGVAKNANVVIVKLDWDPRGEGTDLDLLTGLNLIVNDMHTFSRKKDVINLSIVVTYAPSSTTLQQIVTLMKGMQAKWSTIFVTGVGDQQATSSSNQELAFPASLATEIPMVVVGASDVNGKRAPFSLMSDQITVYAPGVDIVCAAPGGEAQIRSGTSFAAGMVSGLAAYYMSVPRFYEPLARNGVLERPGNMLRLLKQLAWVRSSSGGNVPVIYNGYTPPAASPTCTSAGSKNKREACPLAPSSTFKPTATALSKLSLAVSSVGATVSPPAVLTPPAPPSVVPSPPPPSVAAPPPPPGPSCPACESQCLIFAGRCVSACFFPVPPGSPNNCGKCIQAAGGDQSCVNCFPTCPRIVNCTGKDIFRSCTGFDDLSSAGVPVLGLCTPQPFEGRAALVGGNMTLCKPNEVCDLNVADTPNCIPPPNQENSSP